MRFLQLILFFGVGVNLALSQSQSLQWIQVGENVKRDILNLGLEPAGIEDTSYTYVARVQPSTSDNRRVPGKLKVNYRLIASITDEGSRDYNRFEVLVMPPGSTSWLAATGENLPENSVVGGQLPDGSEAYICRVQHNSATVVVGKYFREGGYCKYLYEDTEYTANTFEILTVNKYGVKIGVDPNPDS